MHHVFVKIRRKNYGEFTKPSPPTFFIHPTKSSQSNPLKYDHLIRSNTDQRKIQTVHNGEKEQQSFSPFFLSILPGRQCHCYVYVDFINLQARNIKKGENSYQPNHIQGRRLQEVRRILTQLKQVLKSY